MGSTNKTPNIDLSQFVDDDKFTIRGDYNGDMVKIDGAIAAQNTTISSATAAANAALAAANDAKADVSTLSGHVDSVELNLTDAIADGDAAVSSKIDEISGVVVPATISGADFANLLVSAAADGKRVVLPAGANITLDIAIPIPTGTRLDGNGATLTNGTGIGSAFLVVANASNVLIENLIIDGNKTAYAPTTEHRHGLSILNSVNVTVRNVISKRNKGDGFYVGDQNLGASVNVNFYNVHADQNHRQGMSVTHASHVYVYGSKFSNTSGTAPSAGVDIEPNVANIACDDIKFIGCEFIGNAGAGALVTWPYANTTSNQGNYHFISCTSKGNASGFEVKNSRSVRIVDCVSERNNGHGIIAAPTSILNDYSVVNCTVRENSLSGINVQAVTYAFKSVSLINNTSVNNSQATPGSHDGISISVNTKSDDLRVIGNTVYGATHRNGLIQGGSAGVTRSYYAGNNYEGASNSDRTLSSQETATRTDLDLVSRQTISGSRGGNAALTSLLAHLSLRGIITDNTTA